MKQAEMFDGVPLGSPNFVSLAKARALVADVEDLANVMDETFYTQCQALARQAESMGAHSVARVCRWVWRVDTLERHGYDAMHFRAEDVAHRWLRRQETKR